MKISNEIKTALIAITVLVLTIWGYSFLKGKNIFKPTDEYYAVYDKIDGLIESGNVNIKGYKVGSITQIKFDHKKSGKFIVKFVLEERVRIPMYSRAVITSSSLIAPAKDIIIELSGENTFHKPGDTLLTDFDEGLLGVIDPLKNKTEELVDKIDQAVTSLNNTLNEDTQKSLKSSIKSLDVAINQFERSIRPGGDLHTSFGNLKDVTQVLKNKNEQIAELIENLHAISDSISSANLQQTLLKLDSTLQATEEIMAKINNGEGTAGMLINDSSLYVNLSNSANSLDLLLKDLNEHPGRYVHVSVFGKKDKKNKD